MIRKFSHANTGWTYRSLCIIVVLTERARPKLVSLSHGQRSAAMVGRFPSYVSQTLFLWSSQSLIKGLGARRGLIFCSLFAPGLSINTVAVVLINGVDYFIDVIGECLDQHGETIGPRVETIPPLLDAKEEPRSFSFFFPFSIACSSDSTCPLSSSFGESSSFTVFLQINLIGMVDA